MTAAIVLAGLLAVLVSITYLVVFTRTDPDRRRAIAAQRPTGAMLVATVVVAGVTMVAAIFTLIGGFSGESNGVAVFALMVGIAANSGLQLVRFRQAESAQLV